MKRAPKDMTEAERLLVMAGKCLNEIPNRRVRLPDAPDIRSSYDVAARIDAYLARRFGKSAHQL